MIKNCEKNIHVQNQDLVMLELTMTFNNLKDFCVVQTLSGAHGTKGWRRWRPPTLKVIYFEKATKIEKNKISHISFDVT